MGGPSRPIQNKGDPFALPTIPPTGAEGKEEETQPNQNITTIAQSTWRKNNIPEQSESIHLPDGVFTFEDEPVSREDATIETIVIKSLPTKAGRLRPQASLPELEPSYTESELTELSGSNRVAFSFPDQKSKLRRKKDSVEHSEDSSNETSMTKVSSFDPPPSIYYEKGSIRHTKSQGHYKPPPPKIKPAFNLDDNNNNNAIPSLMIPKSETPFDPMYISSLKTKLEHFLKMERSYGFSENDAKVALKELTTCFRENNEVLGSILSMAIDLHLKLIKTRKQKRMWEVLTQFLLKGITTEKANFVRSFLLRVDSVNGNSSETHAFVIFVVEKLRDKIDITPILRAFGTIDFEKEESLSGLSNCLFFHFLKEHGLYLWEKTSTKNRYTNLRQKFKDIEGLSLDPKKVKVVETLVLHAKNFCDLAGESLELIYSLEISPEMRGFLQSSRGLTIELLTNRLLNKAPKAGLQKIELEANDLSRRFLARVFLVDILLPDLRHSFTSGFYFFLSKKPSKEDVIEFIDQLMPVIQHLCDETLFDENKSPENILNSLLKKFFNAQWNYIDLLTMPRREMN